MGSGGAVNREKANARDVVLKAGVLTMTGKESKAVAPTPMRM